MFNEWMNTGIHLDLDTWIVPGQILGLVFYAWCQLSCGLVCRGAKL